MSKFDELMGAAAGGAPREGLDGSELGASTMVDGPAVAGEPAKETAPERISFLPGDNWSVDAESMSSKQMLSFCKAAVDCMDGRLLAMSVWK